MKRVRSSNVNELEEYAMAKAEERQATRALSGAIDEMLRTGLRNDQLLEKLNSEMLDAHSKAQSIHDRIRALGHGQDYTMNSAYQAFYEKK